MAAFVTGSRGRQKRESFMQKSILAGNNGVFFRVVYSFAVLFAVWFCYLAFVALSG